MSAPDSIKDGIFAVLDHLPEDVRDGYIDKLPKPTLTAIIRTVWREKDILKARNSGQATTSDRVQLGPSPALTLRSKVENLDHASSVDGTAIKREGTPDKKRRRAFLDSPETSPAPGQKRKKTSSENLEKQSHSSSASVQESEDHNKQATSIKLPSSLSMSNATAGTVSLQLPIFIRFKKSDGHTRQYKIDRLPVAVGTHLRDTFWTFCNKNKTRQEAYRLFTKLLDRYMSRPRCVCDQLRHNMKLSHKGVPIGPQTFIDGGKFRRSADEKCIKDKIPCVHIIPHQDGYAWCIVPLPRAMRVGERWRNMNYWVQR